MKAIVITKPGGPEVLQLQEVEEPKTKPDEILVKVYAAGLNRGELAQRQGLYPAPPGTRNDIPGLEFSGIVEATGPDTSLYKKGDRVMGILPGCGYAEKIVTPEKMAMPIPKNFSFDEAAAIPEVFLTAYDALENRLHLKKGEKILIHAVGSSVGLAALQLAKLAGTFVFATGSREKIEKAMKRGCDVGIDYQSKDFAAAILEATQNRGVEAILDFIGASYFEKNIAALAIQGRMVLVGLLGGTKAKMDLRTMMNKRLTLVGTVLRSRSIKEKIALTQDFQKKILPLFEKGDIKPIIDTIFNFKETAKAHAYMESNKNFGKIILRIQ